MFFSLSICKDTRFPNHHQWNNIWFNCDQGWSSLACNKWKKGYEDNFCGVEIQDDIALIHHSRPRSFPLWYGSGLITNLPCNQAPIQAWADDVVSMDMTGAVESKKQVVDLSIHEEPLTVDQAVILIKSQLDQSVQFIKHNTINLKLFCSGGLDTCLLYAMMVANQLDFQLLVDEHYEHNQFTKTNLETLKSFWGYQQIHHWNQFTWLATGACGDEYFLRGPAVIAMLTAWHNIDFVSMLNQKSDSYHYYHFMKYKDFWQQSWDSRDQLRQQYPTRQSLYRHVVDHLCNDHQHWHLGNTLTWTPYKNIDIAKILLRCPIDDLMSQFLDGAITKQVINMYDPKVLEFVSNLKNYNTTEYIPALLYYHQSKLLQKQS